LYALFREADLDPSGNSRRSPVPDHLEDEFMKQGGAPVKLVREVLLGNQSPVV
jgi:hypothetical protein